MRHSIVLLKDDEEIKNVELKNIKELAEISKKLNLQDFKFNFMKIIGQTNQKKQAEKIFLVPFLSRDQLDQFSNEIIIRMTPELFGVFCNYKPEIIKGKFINNDPIEIVTVYIGIPSVSEDNAVILPSCPVCIKRLDKSISGLNFINCRDLFHSCCQDNCRSLGENCKVCSLLYGDETVMKCFNCGGKENMWVCLICGNLGCGRYKGGHAHDHFLNTGHPFALKSDSHHIWDYTNDRYVHWNIKTDEGTIVDVDEDLKSSDNEIGDDGLVFANQFTTAQLESQKDFYEERLISIKQDFKKEISILKNCKDEEINMIKDELKRSNHERKILSDLSNQLKDHLKKFKQETADLSKELEAEKNISQGLCKTIDNLENSVKISILEKNDLEDQVKDLMKHLEVLDLMNKVGNDPDIVEGKLVTKFVKKKK